MANDTLVVAASAAAIVLAAAYLWRSRDNKGRKMAKLMYQSVSGPVTHGILTSKNTQDRTNRMGGSDEVCVCRRSEFPGAS